MGPGGVVERAYKIMNSKEQEHLHPVVVTDPSKLHVVATRRGVCRALFALCAAALLTTGCSRGEPEQVEDSSVAPPPPLDAASTGETPRIVFLGDSLTAGLGVAPEQAYPALIQQRLRQTGYPDDVINAGVSGDTSAGGLRRLDWSLKGRVHVLVVALGANDGLRGLPPRQLETNLDTIIERARTRGAAVLLAGMEAPPNFGASVHAPVSRRLSGAGSATPGAAGSVPPRGRGRRSRSQSERRHSPERARPPRPRRSRLAAARAPAQVTTHHPMIELRGVSKTVMSGASPLTILHPLDLTVPAGESLAITGPSGSGKSTLLGLIAGLDAPTSGRILIDGTDITDLGEDALARLRGEKIGFVFQFFHLIPSLTALENVLVPMEIAGRADATARARALLDEVGLTGRGHHYPSQLSGGEQQRVALARALANDPPILLADEPTGNLDSANGRHIMDLLLQVNRARRTTLVLVTHDASLARWRARSCRSAMAGRSRRTMPRPRSRRRRDHEVRASDGRPRNAGVLAAPAVLLPLHRHRRRRDRGAAIDHPERPRRAGRPGAVADCGRRARERGGAAVAGRAAVVGSACRCGRRQRARRERRDRDHGPSRRSVEGRRPDGGTARRSAGVPLVRDARSRGGKPYRHALLRDHGALVRPELLTQLGVAEGDEILVGDLSFTIRGVIEHEPGRRVGGFSLGPRVLIDYAAVQEAGLLSFGSRARYQVMLKVDEQRLDPLMKGLRADFRNTFVTARSYRSTEDEIGQDLQRAENYLSLVGLVVVVLGGIGVSSVTRVFIDQKMKSIAVLKCVGAGTWQVVSVYLLQVMALGLAGSLMGLALGRLALAAAPSELGTGGATLPLVSRAHARRDAPGVGIGLMVSLLFSLLPLLRVRHIKPSLLLRAPG